jgi:hypothetical protein
VADGDPRAGSAVHTGGCSTSPNPPNRVLTTSCAKRVPADLGTVGAFPRLPYGNAPDFRLRS